MTAFDGKQLRAIARMTEAAYRRGYQQGMTVAECFTPLHKELADWRYEESLDWSPPAPGSGSRPRYSSLERLLMENPQLREFSDVSE